jgi:iron(III) transport system ATP-binding protein
MKDIRVKGLNKSFGAVKVVSDVSFDLKAGQFLTLLGPSGCGKTTTLRLLAGLEAPDSGTIEVGGVVLASGERKYSMPPERRGMGMVFQNYAIWPHKTVFQNVAFSLQARHVPRREIRGRVLSALDSVGLAHFHDRPAPLLSGGQQQRVALARALVSNPDVLLLDEPLSNLDAALREEMRFELKSLQSKLGLTTIFVTHDQSEAMALSDQVVVMKLGVIEQQDTPRGVYERPGTRFVMGVLGPVNQLTGVVGRGSAGTTVAVVHDSDGPVEIDIPESADWPDGTEVVIAFRVEAIQLDGSATVGQLAGELVSTIYLGSHAEHLVRVGDATLRVSSSTEKPLPEAGAAVRVGFAADAIRVWPKAVDGPTTTVPEQGLIDATP